MSAALKNGTARRAAAERYLASVDVGLPLTGRDLAAEFGRSESWGRDVIRGARGVEVAAGGTAATSASQRHWLDSGVVLVVALIAAIASYSHMYAVALVAGEPLWVARAIPLTVDGLVLAALRRGGPGRPWLLLGLAASVAGNVLSHYPAAVVTVAPGISAWPAVALYGCHCLVNRPDEVSS